MINRSGKIFNVADKKSGFACWVFFGDISDFHGGAPAGSRDSGGVGGRLLRVDWTAGGLPSAHQLATASQSVFSAIGRLQILGGGILCRRRLRHWTGQLRVVLITEKTRSTLWISSFAFGLYTNFYIFDCSVMRILFWIIQRLQMKQDDIFETCRICVASIFHKICAKVNVIHDSC